MTKFHDTTRLDTCPLCGADVTQGNGAGLAKHLPDCPAGDLWRPGEPWAAVERRLA